MRSFLIIVTFLYVLSACTKEVKMDYPSSEKQLVVEGYIESGRYPVVYLTKSSPYFEKIDSSNVAKLIASVAKVSISDGEETEVLTLRYSKNIFPPYYYEGTDIRGKIGKSYTITVELEGKTYTSNTTLLEPVSLQKISFIKTTNNNEQNFLSLNFLDPKGVKNCYRVYTKRIGKDSDFIPCYLSTFNDYGFDGQEFNFEVIRSYSSVKQADNERYFVKGDSVMVKFCTIDDEQHNYWKSVETQIAISANPFGFSSSEPLTLIKGGALGVWAGLSSKYYSIKID
ncbi:MAG: DUF4249 domain-containing protein [Crocinitomicaceae bacterium]|nr:DUF4249 domain-containing protein [Crocinitomicaceae bacterium]